MQERIRDLLKKYKEIILYIFFGGLTTLVNIGTYFLCTRALGMGMEPADILAWIVGVLFAYVTNKWFVFQSRSWRGRAVLIEFAEFVGARVLSLLVELAFLELTVTLLHWWDAPMKILSNVLVIIINYIFSKLVIFRKREKENS